jgi:hypothetical protein
MEVLDLNIFLSFKNDDRTQELDIKTSELLNTLFTNFNKKKSNKVIKGSGNILKNHKIQNKKDSITNRVNLILNKLSESNMDLLIIEFLENINQVDEENFIEIQKAFYIKIISEINFIKIYFQFFKILSSIYFKIQNYDISYLISICETKFKVDYMNYDLPDNYSFLIESNEMKRINNLILIKHLVDNKIMSDKLMEECDNVILNQLCYLPDIYYWLNNKNRELTKEESEKIKLLLKTKNIVPREKVLLESLLNKSHVKNNMIKQDTNINNDTLKLEFENIIDEYVLMKSIDDIKFFINNRCHDAIAKNKFCEQLINKFFILNKEGANDIIELCKNLIKAQILFKSNLSRGLLMINNNWKDISIDYNKPIEKMKLLLTTLKNIGITKGLEFLLDLYNI